MTFGEWLRWFSNLFVKEFLTYFIDPASRFILVVPLIIQIFLFGYTATFDLNHAPIAVLNESHGRFSQQLVSQIGASPTFYIRRYLDNASQMKDELNPRDSLAIVHIQSILIPSSHRANKVRCRLLLTAGTLRQQGWRQLNFLRSFKNLITVMSVFPKALISRRGPGTTRICRPSGTL